jgi:hypothetical protein
LKTNAAIVTGGAVRSTNERKLVSAFDLFLPPELRKIKNGNALQNKIAAPITNVSIIASLIESIFFSYVI